MGKYPKIFLYFVHKMTCKFLSEYYNSYGELIPHFISLCLLIEETGINMYRGNDILKIYDQDLNNIGRATREEVHTQGLLHQVAHVWMFQPKEDDTYIMIQKRALDRELYPSKYDLIQTTHFDPDESYEEAIVDSLQYYRGLKKSKEDIIHVGSTHQQIDVGDYHDNALVQVFAIFTAKALFIMPDTEEIVKVRFEDFRQLIHGKQNTIKLYSLDDVYLKESSADEWWLRKDEFVDVVEPYIDSRIEEL